MKTFCFKPDLRIYRDGDLLVITFDSHCPQDATRGIRSVRVPVDYKTMSVKVDGFTTKDDDEKLRTICGTIWLVIANKDEQEETHLLAECVMMFEASMLKSLPLYDKLPTPKQIGHFVHQGVAEALNAALNAFLQEYELTCQYQRFQVGQGAHEPTPTVTMVPQRSRDLASWFSQKVRQGRSIAPANDEHPTMKKIKFAAVVLCAGLVAWVGMGAVITKQTPVEKAAVAAAMNPQDIDAQVRLTTETLKQMGIDPGNPQEMGCLGQQ
jgi:hypothetical protein